MGEMRRLVAISSNFDAGNADVVGLDVGAGTVRARLRIRKEPFTEGTDKKHHSQWFVRVQCGKKNHRLHEDERIMANANGRRARARER